MAASDSSLSPAVLLSLVRFLPDDDNVVVETVDVKIVDDMFPLKRGSFYYFSYFPALFSKKRLTVS